MRLVPCDGTIYVKILRFILLVMILTALGAIYIADCLRGGAVSVGVVSYFDKEGARRARAKAIDRRGFGLFYMGSQLDLRVYGPRGLRYDHGRIADLLKNYGFRPESIVWQLGGRGPDVGWLLEPPRGLDFDEILRFASLSHKQKTPVSVNGRGEARAMVVHHISITAGQVWLGCEDDDYYYFSGGNVAPTFDFSVGTAVCKKTGDVYYWYPQDGGRAKRPRLEKAGKR